MVRKWVNRKGEVEYCNCYHCRRCDTANGMCHCDVGKCWFPKYYDGSLNS